MLTRFALDPTGFPLIDCPPAGVAVGLLPVTRAQFEYYLGDVTGFPPAAYAEVAALCPRASWRAIPADHPERVFAAGLHAAECDRFARWLGPGFRLPTEAEWRAVDAAFGQATDPAGPLRRLAAHPALHPAARAVLAWAAGQVTPPAWRAAGLLANGLLEWVALPGGRYGLHGRPRPGLLRSLHNPQRDPAVRPLSADRHPAFGFRLVRPLPPSP